MKYKSYTFWIALASAVVILVNTIGDIFGFNVSPDIITNLIMAICGLLVVLGVVTQNVPNNTNEQSTQQNIDDIQNINITKENDDIKNDN